MTTDRDIMTADAECVRSSDTLHDAACKMRDLEIGAMPICGDDDRLAGMVTDRDITRAIADDRDPASTTVIDLGQHEVVTVGADDPVEEVLRTMAQHQVRRLPVIDGHDLVGMISQKDVALNLPEDRVGDLVEAISHTS